MSSLSINAQSRLGNRLIRFCGVVLIVSSIVKCLHPAKAVAYMAFLGYQSDKLFVIAVIELVTGFLFLLPRTRPIGLLLVSSYLGGAIAAHLGYHPLTGTAPIILFSAHHHYLGSLPALIVLLSGWAGVWLNHPESLRELSAQKISNPPTVKREELKTRTLLNNESPSLG